MLVRPLRVRGAALRNATRSARCSCSFSPHPSPATGTGCLDVSRWAPAAPTSAGWNGRRPYASLADQLATASPLRENGQVPVDVTIWWDAESCPPPSDITGTEALNALYNVATNFGSLAHSSDFVQSPASSDSEGNFLAFRAYGDWATRSSHLLQQLESQPVTLLDAPHEGISNKLTSDIRLITDAVAFAVAHNARYAGHAGRRPSRKLKLVMALGTGDYEYTIQRLRQLGNEVVVIMPRPPPTKADSSMLSMFSTGAKVLGGQLDWTTDVLQPSLTAASISDLDRPVEVPFWAPFLQRPSTIGSSAVHTSPNKRAGGIAATFMPLVHVLQHQSYRGVLTQRELIMKVKSDDLVTDAEDWDGHIDRAIRAGLLARIGPAKNKPAKGKSDEDGGGLVLQPRWYANLIELELQSFASVQSAAVAISRRDLPWSDEQSDLAVWVDDPVNVFGPLVEVLSEPQFSRKPQTVEKVQAKLAPHFSVAAAHVAGDEGNYLELAAQAGLLCPEAWDKGRVRLADEWWPTLYRLTLASLLRPREESDVPFAGLAGVAGQTIVTADLARPFIDAVSHFHQLKIMKPTQEQLRRHIADHDPSIYRRAGVGGWDDYIRSLQDADLVFDDGMKGVSLENFWYITLIKLELVANGSLRHAMAAEAARAQKPTAWSPRQAKVVDQTPEPLMAFVPFLGQMLHARRGGRHMPTTQEGMRSLINPKAYRVARLTPNDVRSYLALAENAGILSHDQRGNYFLTHEWWSGLYRVHLAALARAYGLADS